MYPKQLPTFASILSKVGVASSVTITSHHLMPGEISVGKRWTHHKELNVDDDYTKNPIFTTREHEIAQSLEIERYRKTKCPRNIRHMIEHELPQYA